MTGIACRRRLVAAAGICAAASLLAGPAVGRSDLARLGDGRIREVAFDPHAVVELRAAPGYVVSVAFDPLERVSAVAIGDSANWQVSAPRAGGLLFVKPMGRSPPTNMTVVTNLRRYHFRLARSAPGAPPVFAVRFRYEEPATARVVGTPRRAPPQEANRAYSYTGSAKNLPSRMFDDGEATYFQFPRQADLPAIFVVEPDGEEAVVNSFVRDGYVVVDRLARGFVLRRGGEVTRITNDAYREASAGPLSPQPGAKPKRGRR